MSKIEKRDKTKLSSQKQPTFKIGQPIRVNMAPGYVDTGTITNIKILGNGKFTYTVTMDCLNPEDADIIENLHENEIFDRNNEWVQ